MAVIKRIQSNYNSILRAKIHFFLKKSLWMYLISMFLIGYAIPIASLGIFLSSLIYFFCLIIILIPIYHFSAKAIANKNSFDADIEFNEQHIIIRHRNKAVVETKEWDWVKKLDITDRDVFLVVYNPNRFLISLSKNSLSESELQFFEKKKGNI